MGNLKEEFHKDSLFDTPIHHLVESYDFNPSVSCTIGREEIYHLYVRHSADSNCNLLK